MASDAAQCYLPCNLSIVVLEERLSTSFDAGISACTTPSGIVPRGGVDACVLKIQFISSGQ
jgi:hypothetical protein